MVFPAPESSSSSVPDGPIPASSAQDSSSQTSSSPEKARAAEDDPRRWGDSSDDLGEFFLRERPPHW